MSISISSMIRSWVFWQSVAGGYAVLDHILYISASTSRPCFRRSSDPQSFPLKGIRLCHPQICHWRKSYFELMTTEKKQMQEKVPLFPLCALLWGGFPSLMSGREEYPLSPEMEIALSLHKQNFTKKPLSSFLIPPNIYLLKMYLLHIEAQAHFPCLDLSPQLDILC